MTVDLEKELLKQNRKIVSARELLFIQEYEKFSSIIENDALQRVGMTQSLEEGRYRKEQINQALKETTKFKQERVFHISQIKAICKKYHLKFLGSSWFKGTIDPELANKISTFEIAYGVKCHSRRTKGRWSWTTEGNTFIMAPAQSFDLQAKPKDPLFFYQINEEYFFLIHKWGDDLSIGRRLLSLFSFWGSWFVPFVLASVILSIIFGAPPLAVFGIGLGSILVAILVRLFFALASDFDGQWGDPDNIPYLVLPNKWDSIYTS